MNNQSKIPLELGTKAETIFNISSSPLAKYVLPLLFFKYKDWDNKRDLIIGKIQEFAISVETKKLIIRSSAKEEDSSNSSMAGKFLSLDNVELRKVCESIDKVFSSYGSPGPEDQVLIQPMLEGIQYCGVIFTRDQNSGSPYYVASFDLSGSNHGITSGMDCISRTYYHFKISEFFASSELKEIVELCKLVEEAFDNDCLDIEFAKNDKGIFLLQVRQLIIKSADLKKPDFVNDLYLSLKRIHNKIQEVTGPHPYAKGSKGIMGIMPDWNPAEIIGVKPRPLAFSLYRELVTDNIWAYQRKKYGYKDMRSFPLIYSLEGLPYVDVRASLNSFLPETLSEEISQKLADFYLNKLKEQPCFHDKVEFNIVYSCLTFNSNESLDELLQKGFCSDEIKQIYSSLKLLTNNIIHFEKGLWVDDKAKINSLMARCDLIINSDLKIIQKIYWLVEDCKRFGTLPFAGLARAGFIAVQLLKSLVKMNIISEENYECFMSSLSTVSTQLGKDFASHTKEDFLKKYGHLRPGSYDILTPSYEESPCNYFSWDDIQPEQHKRNTIFALSIVQLKEIESALNRLGLETNAIQLFDFLKEAIEGREYAKFVFSRNLSKVLSYISSFTNQLDISKEDASYLDYEDIKKLFISSQDARDLLISSINNNKSKHKITEQLNLPPLISNPNEIWSFEMPQGSPNYITFKTITARTVDIKNKELDLQGSIVFIDSADPGFDWIFSKNISGFVTKFGGANSHMAIRASELGIPAVIGAGEIFFNSWKKAKTIKIDCLNKRTIEVL
jgi:phosphoenolpyruvate synthase/pyruvate phosphate dikinase